MIIDRNFSTTSLTLTPADALELIRQLADAVNGATRRNGVSSFCSGTTLTEQGQTTQFPGVLNVVVDAR